MGVTDGTWEQYGSFPDGQLFIGAKKFTDGAAHATLANPSSGIIALTVPSTDASTLFTDVAELLFRTGVYAGPNSQEQFGTAAAVPGPSKVAGTSGPLAFIQGRPPMLGAQMATVAGSQAGPPKKGVMITSIDVIYEVATVAATAAQVGVTSTVFANGVAPVVTNIITLGANGLTTTVATEPAVINVPVTTPIFLTSGDQEVIINLNLTAGSGGTVVFYGVVLHLSYNFN
jgi:hypothetical protein